MIGDAIGDAIWKQLDVLYDRLLQNFSLAVDQRGHAEMRPMRCQAEDPVAIRYN